MPAIEAELFIKDSANAAVKPRNKVTVIGAGQVGTATAFSILLQNVSSDIALVDIDENKLKGELMDFLHGSSFFDANITASSDLKVSAGSSLIIIAAGVRQKEGESRLALLERNVETIKSIVPKVLEFSPDATLLIMTNPCDVMSYVAWKLSGLPKNRVFGSGNNLDSSRFRFALSQKLGVGATSTHGWVIGEHGDSSVPVWSEVNVAGVPLQKYCPSAGQEGDPDNWNQCHKDVVSAAYEVISLKGYTSWAGALSTADIASAFLNNDNSVKAVSTLVKGVHGIDKEVFLSLPCVINANGVSSIVKQTLSADEVKKLQASANIIDEVQKKISF